MIDIRYHIYSLVAVFLALAVGIVIGSSFAQRAPLADQARRTIERYENLTQELRSQIEAASETAARRDAVASSCEEFCRAVMPVVVKDRLLGWNAAIIRTGDYPALEGSVKRALQAAGAQVSSVTEMSREFAYDEDAAIDKALSSAGLRRQDGVGARDLLFQTLVGAILSAKNQHLLPKLEEAGVAQFSGDYRRFNRLVVLIGGAKGDDSDTSESIDARLIDHLQKLGATVVGCEPSGAVSSYVPAWHKKGIASVDNAETAMGQTALICALSGESACFGAKETADRMIPQSLEKR